MIFLEIILPVFLLVFAGYSAQKLLRLNVKSISKFVLYLLFPALSFRSFYTADINMDYLWIIIYSITLTLAIILIVKAFSFALKYSEEVESGLILSSAFMNNGNLGILVILFAFGTEGFEYAVPIAVIHIIFMNIFGVYYAARGESGIKYALLETLKMPILHAFFIALLLKYIYIPVSESILDVIFLVADAAIPSITLVLGLQLAQIKLGEIKIGKISLAIFIRLLISPLIAFAIVSILPVSALLGKVMIVAGAMPTAVITTLFAVQYDSEPALVSGVAFFSTLLSAFTLPLLLIFL